MSRLIGCRVWFDWDFNGTFTDESANLVRCEGEARFHPPEAAITASQGIVDRCSIELRNTAGRYSALNTGGALYAYVQGGGAYHVPVRVDTTINGTDYVRVFTGVTKIPRETGRSWQEMPTVSFECRGLDELLLQKRMSTTQSGMVTRYTTGFTEAQIIDAFLVAAGVTGQQIDAGMITIPWSWLDNESVLEDVWTLAAATGGRFYYDKSGVPRYENMAHWIKSPHKTSQATYTNADWQTFEAVYDDNELYDSISVEYAGRQPDTVAVLWEPDEDVIVPAGTTSVITATFSNPAYTTPALTWRAATLGGTDITASVSVGVTQYAQRAVLTITNSHATLQARISPFQLSGRPVVGSPSAEETRTAAADGTNAAFFTNRGSRDKSVRGNVYIQTKAQAGFLAQLLLDRYEFPLLSYRLGGMLADPARIPGDRITVNDVSVMSSGRPAMVIGISWRFTEMAYTMDVEAVDASTLYRYLDTSPSYFVVGTNKLGAADPLRARIFY